MDSNTLEQFLKRYRTSTLRSKAWKHYELFSEAELLCETQHLEYKQAEAASLLETGPLAKILFAEYKELFPGVRGELAIEEAHAADFLATVALAVRGACLAGNLELTTDPKELMHSDRMVREPRKR